MTTTTTTTARNRRHAHMARALDAAGYFNPRAMRRRAPGLFDTMVGVSTRECDAAAPDDAPETVSDAIFAREDAREYREAVTRARDALVVSRASTMTDGVIENAAVDGEIFGEAFGGWAGGGGASSDGTVSEAAWRRAMFQGWGGVAGGRGGDLRNAYASTATTCEDDDGDGGAADANAADAEETLRARSTFVLDVDDYCASGGTSTAYLSQREYASRLADFERVMRERFLAGEDEEMDYARVDADASLDDYWAKEIQRDAEDRYFDAD